MMLFFILELRRYIILILIFASVIFFFKTLKIVTTLTFFGPVGYLDRFRARFYRKRLAGARHVSGMS